MDVIYSKITDFDAWIALAREVEPLFGPMAEEKAFQKALRQAIIEKTAFCILSDPNEKDSFLKGGIVISKESNEIVWFAVSEQYRRIGYGRQLLEVAINKLNPQESVFVQTFDGSVSEGKAARKLYFDFGFTDHKNGGLNPAGVPTVIMKLEKQKPIKFPISHLSTGDKKIVKARLYGSGNMAIIFSNMDTNDQNEWAPIINQLICYRYMILTYDYPEHMNDQSETLEDAISFVSDLGAKKIILIGASRGGVASIKVAAQHINNESIVGVAALSAPIEYEGTVFYSKGDLNGIKIPKLLINSKNDDGANDNRKMLKMFDEPKELLLYPGDAHGTELFDKEESIIAKLQNFIDSAFTRCENLM
ncbi:MAG: GNAT family N-acetyltransferase [Desulfobacteraceae bacterium]|nr:GNAT family N-acetyltransferase [Desulfobacteraceae bacterium]